MNAQTGPIRPSTTAMAAVLYRSSAAMDRAEFEASGAPAAFAARNRDDEVTGYLHLEDGVFYQHLEGPAAAVSRLWQSIAADSRHRDVTLISRGPVGCRRFARWAMGYNAVEPRSLFDWTARSGLSLKGPNYPQVITAFLEYASAGTRLAV